MRIRSTLLTTFCLGIAASAAAQSNPIDYYSTLSFEVPTFKTGQLVGQNGWTMTGTGTPNIAGATVQPNASLSGSQDVHWTAVGETSSEAYLTRAISFGVMQKVLEVEFDFKIASGTAASDGWGLNVRVTGGAELLTWYVDTKGIINFHDGVRGWVTSGTMTIQRDRWYHARTIVHKDRHGYDLFIDQRGMFAGAGVVTKDYTHTASAIYLRKPASDSIQVDNFGIRTRDYGAHLGTDVKTLSVLRGGKVRFALWTEGGRGPITYGLLGGMSGNSPGVTMPGGLNFPVNIDALSFVILANLNTPVFDKFTGTFGKHNTGYSTLNAAFPLPAAMLNQTLTFAFAKINPYDLVSQPATIRVTL